jgi:hypothetical protein
MEKKKEEKRSKVGKKMKVILGKKRKKKEGKLEKK